MGRHIPSWAGYARIATLLKQARKENPDEVGTSFR